VSTTPAKKDKNFEIKFLKIFFKDLLGRRYRRFIPYNFLLSLVAPHLHGVLVLVTGEKFFAGVVVTADNWSPVSTINLSLVSTTPAITENP
jgi:hypothetical protein